MKRPSPWSVALLLFGLVSGCAKHEGSGGGGGHTHRAPHGGTLVEVDGREVRTGNPIEIVSTRRELQYMRQGLKRAGRAGMGMLAAQSSVSELGDLAAAHPD